MFQKSGSESIVKHNPFFWHRANITQTPAGVESHQLDDLPNPKQPVEPLEVRPPRCEDPMKWSGGFLKWWGFPPKSSILIGFSIINHPFWGTTIFGNTHLGGGFFQILLLFSARIFVGKWSNLTSDFLGAPGKNHKLEVRWFKATLTLDSASNQWCGCQTKTSMKGPTLIEVFNDQSKHQKQNFNDDSILFWSFGFVGARPLMFFPLEMNFQIDFSAEKSYDLLRGWMGF